MHLTKSVFAIITFAVIAFAQAQDVPYQNAYAANLTAGDSVINIVNTGANGDSIWGPGFGGAQGNICVNVYAFSPDEQLVACCSCLVTPHALVSLSVVQDLISNTLTGVRPNSVSVSLLATATGAGPVYTGTSCNNSAAGVGTAFPIASGMLAWMTTTHTSTTPPGITEHAFRPSTLSAGALASMANRCTNIIGNGSTYGICKSCRFGGLGAGRL